MPVSTTPSRVILICEPGPTQQQVSNALRAEKEFQLVDVLPTTEDQIREIKSANPQIILIDHEISEPTLLDAIDELAIQLPEVAIIAILPTNDPLMAQQVMLAGARGFIAHPFTQINLLSTVRRLRDLERRRQKSQGDVSTRTTALRQQPLRTIAVYSPRGGVGCSTVAANLAIKLHQQTNQQVLLLEGKLFMGHLGLMLNIRTDNTIADLVPHATQLDESLVHDVTIEHASGIHVLLGPFDIQIAQGIRPEDMYNIVEGVQQAYDYVVIDIGTDLSENAVTMMDAADKVVVVMNPELASLHDTQRFIDLSRSTLAYPPEKLLFVLNRADMPGGVSEQEIKSAMNREIFSEIPDIGPKGLRSLNRGIPLAINYPRSTASRAIQKMTSKMLEMSALPSPLGGSQQAQSREEAGGLAPASGD